MADNYYEQFLEAYSTKEDIPVWVKDLYKSLASKNITLDDWNTLVAQARSISAEVEAIYDYIQALEASEYVVSVQGPNSPTPHKGAVVLSLNADFGITLTPENINALPQRVQKLENNTSQLDDSKLDKISTTGSFRLYGVTDNGNQIMHRVSDGVINEAVVSRTINGQILVPDIPAVDSHATSKKYVDEADSTKLDKSGTGGFSAYTHVGSTQNQTPVSQSALNGVIVQRISGGQITVPKTPSNDTDATSKKYVDGEISDGITTASSTAAGYVAAEEERAIAAEVSLSQRITAQEGLGGSLDAHDFGKTTPTQQELTDYALLQIPSIEGDTLKIWNGTRVTNLYDNNVWQLTNTQNTNPAIFEWANIGSAMIAKASNETLGIVKGSDTVKVNAEGEVYTSVSLIGAIPNSREPEINQAVEKVNNAVANMEATLGLAALWDAEGENELLDAEGENLLSVAHIDANSINGREFYVMTKAEHAALVSAGTYIPDAFYLTF